MTVDGLPLPAIGINHAADGNAGDELGIAHNHLRRAAVVVDQHNVANTSIGGIQPLRSEEHTSELQSLV